MRLLIATDHHFFRTRGGEVHPGPPTAVLAYSFWLPYLEVFEEVAVLARLRRVREVAPELPRADGPGVRFCGLPDYLGPWQYLRHLPTLRTGTRSAAVHADAFILRVPGAIGQLAWRTLRPQPRAPALEVIADPWEMYSPGAVPSPVRPIVRRAWSRELRLMCQQASAVCYVTEEALQRRYPPGPTTWATYASDAVLDTGYAGPDDLQDRLERIRNRCRGQAPRSRLRLGFLGSFAQMTKAPDVLLQAVAISLRSGSDVELVLAGDGKYREPMERLSKELGIESRVRFVGSLLPGVTVKGFLDQTDLFVLPSRTEGLPRSLLEAMARACPCIGTAAGGIPELLCSEDLVAVGDARALAGKIQEVLADPGRMARMAERNLERAKKYDPFILAERKRSFYTKVRELSESKRS